MKGNARKLVKTAMVGGACPHGLQKIGLRRYLPLTEDALPHNMRGGRCAKLSAGFLLRQGEEFRVACGKS